MTMTEQTAAPKYKHKRGHIPGFSDERSTAEELGLRVDALRKWRRQGIGPPYAKIGKQIFYPDEARAEWLKSRVVEPIRELTAA
jgi:hypothetical protein